jgi:hypothetical protein
MDQDAMLWLRDSMIPVECKLPPKADWSDVFYLGTNNVGDNKNNHNSSGFSLAGGDSLQNSTANNNNNTINNSNNNNDNDNAPKKSLKEQHVDRFVEMGYDRDVVTSLVADMPEDQIDVNKIANEIISMTALS